MSRVRARCRKRCPEATRIFIEPPSFDALVERLTARGADSPEQIERRLAAAREELEARDEFPHHVVQRRPGARCGGDCSACRYDVSALIKPRLDKLLERVDSHYAVVLVAAKRARQINSYYHNLGEGTFDEYPPPMVETGSKNYLKISLEEIAAGKIKYRYR